MPPPTPGNFRADIEHEVVAVGKIDVSIAALQVHRLVSRCRASIVVGCRILRRVGLGFDDAAGHSKTGKVADDDFADEISSQGHRPDWQLRPTEPAYRDFVRRLGADIGSALMPRTSHIVTIRPKYRFKYLPRSLEPCICRYVTNASIDPASK